MNKITHTSALSLLAYDDGFAPIEDRLRANIRSTIEAVECMFADAKTRGFNIEDTHITEPDKLATLLLLVALAVTWAYLCATRVMGRGAIPRIGHGRREKSWFRTGLGALRNWHPSSMSCARDMDK
jgi:hypothetical protein